MAETTVVTVPHESVNDTSVKLLAALVAEGGAVEVGRAVASLEGSKATFEVTAPVAGRVRWACRVGDEVPVGGALFRVETGDAVVETLAVVAPAVNGSAARFSQSALKLLAERGIAAEAVPLTGLVRERELREWLAGGGGQPPVHPSNDRRFIVQEMEPKDQGVPLSRGADAPRPLDGNIRREPLSRMKRYEGRALRSAARDTLASVVSVAVPATGLRTAARRPELGGSLTPVIVYEAARLLRRYPVFNACPLGDDVGYYESVNVGFALDTGRGLKVPVVRDADRKALPEVAREIGELALADQAGTLPVASLGGGTFTVSDLGSDDVLTVHPLLNQGQSAILAVGGELSVGSAGFFVLALAFDHQLAEGRTAAAFLRELRDRLVGYAKALGAPARPSVSCTRCLRGPAEVKALNGFLVPTIGDGGAAVPVCSLCLGGF